MNVVARSPSPMFRESKDPEKQVMLASSVPICLGNDPGTGEGNQTISFTSRYAAVTFQAIERLCGRELMLRLRHLRTLRKYICGGQVERISIHQNNLSYYF